MSITKDIKTRKLLRTKAAKNIPRTNGNSWPAKEPVGRCVTTEENGNSRMLIP